MGKFVMVADGNCGVVVRCLRKVHRVHRPRGAAPRGPASPSG
jgi:hypothetical protein